MGDLFAWLISFFILIGLLIIIVYQLMCLADLEYDYINPYDSASRINKVILPEFVTQGVLALFFLVTGHWFMTLLCVPYLYYNVKMYMDKQHFLYVAEIFNVLNWEKKKRLFKLTYLIAILLVSFFWMGNSSPKWARLNQDEGPVNKLLLSPPPGPKSNSNSHSTTIISSDDLATIFEKFEILNSRLQNQDVEIKKLKDYVKFKPHNNYNDENTPANKLDKILEKIDQLMRDVTYNTYYMGEEGKPKDDHAKFSKNVTLVDLPKFKGVEDPHAHSMSIK